MIRAERAADIQEAASRWQAVGGGLVFVTLTLPHRMGERLAPLLDIAMKGWREMLKGRPWRAFVARHEVRGFVRSVEVTVGSNGWHPHIHALIFTESAADAEAVEAMRSVLSERWASVVLRLGGRRPSDQHGVDVQAADSDGRVLAGYLAKVQEKRPKIGAEMARFDLKQGRAESRTPFELLDTDSPRDAALWVEYVEATKGRRIITWDRNLRDFLGMTAERTEEEIIADTDASVLLFAMEGEVYDSMRRRDPESLARLLELVEEGAADVAAGSVGARLLEGVLL